MTMDTSIDAPASPAAARSGFWADYADAWRHRRVLAVRGFVQR